MVIKQKENENENDLYPHDDKKVNSKTLLQKGCNHSCCWRLMCYELVDENRNYDGNVKAIPTCLTSCIFVIIKLW